MAEFKRDLQYWKFSAYGFVKNLQFFDPFMVLFFREMGMSFLQIGVLYSVREVVTNLTEIPTGIAADSFGRRSSMVAAFASYIVSFILFYLFPIYGVYFLAMSFFALGESFRSGTHKAMIMEYLTQQGIADQKISYYGHTRAWSQKGSALSALIAGALVFFSGSYRSVFLWSIIPYLAGMVLIISYPKELDFSCDTGDEGDEECGETALKRGVEDAKRTVKGFIELFTAGGVRRALVNSSLFEAGFKTVKDYVQPVLRNLALALPVAGMLAENQRIAVTSAAVYFVLYLLTSAASSRSGRFFSLFSSRRRGLNLTYLLGAAAMGLIGFGIVSGIRWLAVLLFVAYYLLENLRRPATLEYLSDRIKGSVMATGLSGESQLKTLLVAVMAPLFGFGADTLGLGWALVCLALIPLMAYPLLRFRKE